MTTRQYILDILDDAHSQDELILRLCDFVEGEQDRFFQMGERSRRHAANSLESVVSKYNQRRAVATLA